MLPEPAPFTSKATGRTYRHPSNVEELAQQKIRNNKEDCINIIKWAKQWEDYKNQVVKIEVDVKARKIVVVNEDEWKEREVRRKMRESIDKSKEKVKQQRMKNEEERKKDEEKRNKEENQLKVISGFLWFSFVIVLLILSGPLIYYIYRHLDIMSHVLWVGIKLFGVLYFVLSVIIGVSILIDWYKNKT